MSRSRGLWLATSESSQTGEAESAFEAMLDGWRDQQRSRLLNENTIANRERVVRRFCLTSRSGSRGPARRRRPLLKPIEGGEVRPQGSAGLST